jgi:hypothetical protein
VTGSLARRALDELLRVHPNLDVVRVRSTPASDVEQPWVLIDLGDPSGRTLRVGDRDPYSRVGFQ